MKRVDNDDVVVCCQRHFYWTGLRRIDGTRCGKCAACDNPILIHPLSEKQAIAAAAKVGRSPIFICMECVPTVAFMHFNIAPPSPAVWAAATEGFTPEEKRRAADAIERVTGVRPTDA